MPSSNAKSCIQVLGGIGFTHEHDAHLYLRRAMSLRSLVGSSDAAAERARPTGPSPAYAARCTSTSRAVTRPSAATSGPRRSVSPRSRPTELRPALVENGYLTPHWPAPYGLGADAVTQIVIDDELNRAGVKRPDIVIAGWAVPTILEHGTDEQRETVREAVAAG